MIIVAIVLLVALLIMLTKFPALQSDNHSDAKQGSFSASLSPGAYSPLALGSISAILLRWRTNGLLELFDSLRCRRNSGMTAGFAANYLTGTMVCFFIGRFTGTGSSVASHHTKSRQPTH